jgi:hypothetical protein
MVLVGACIAYKSLGRETYAVYGVVDPSDCSSPPGEDAAIEDAIPCLGNRPHRGSALHPQRWQKGLQQARTMHGAGSEELAVCSSKRTGRGVS